MLNKKKNDKLKKLNTRKRKKKNHLLQVRQERKHTVMTWGNRPVCELISCDDKLWCDFVIVCMAQISNLSLDSHISPAYSRPVMCTNSVTAWNTSLLCFFSSPNLVVTLVLMFPFMCLTCLFRCQVERLIKTPRNSGHIGTKRPNR